MESYINKYIQQDNTYIDEEGVYHESAKDFLFTGILDFCGCFEELIIPEKIIPVLKYIKEELSKRRGWETYVKEDFGGDYSQVYLILHHLEKCNLIEHGTSARCSWITDKGNKVLYDLQQQDW